MTDCVSRYISLGSDTLHYLQTGNGKKLLVAFHGYGNDATIFLPLCNKLTEEFTCIIVDLPHHGNSKWDGEYLKPEQIVKLLRGFINRVGVDKVTLAGYSLGGRVCLKLAELIPDAIDKIILLASDGLRFNTFYYFLTRTIPGKWLFTSFLKNPKAYSFILETARKMQLISNVRYNLAMRYIRRTEDRDLLLRVWMSMSLLIPDITELKRFVPQHKIKVLVFMGIHDNIIQIRLGKSFKFNIPSSELIELEKGHKLLDADTIPLIANHILTA